VLAAVHLADRLQTEIADRIGQLGVGIKMGIRLALRLLFRRKLHRSLILVRLRLRKRVYCRFDADFAHAQHVVTECWRARRNPES